jgi:putative polyketide hydroxylase
MVFGARYASSAVVGDGDPPPAPANPVTDYVPNAFPGCRAPHAWLDVDGERRSTLDLFGTRFIALVAGDDEHAPVTGAPVQTIRVWSADVMNLYGLRRGTCVLVRPDGHVAWRGPTQRCANALRTVTAHSQ